MLKTIRNPSSFHFILALSFVFILGIFFLPTMSGAEVADCDKGCDDHGESVCGCLGCPPVTIVCEIPYREHNPRQTVHLYSIFNCSIDLEREFFDRLDRPPQIFLS